MATEVKRLIQVRTDKGARFKRDGFGKKRQLSDSWRKPRGQHNKQREQKKAKGALPKPGFGSPVAVRGMHPSGFFEVLVTSLTDLEGLDPKTQAVRIGATVGTRKRTIIQDQALTAGLRVLNAKVVKTVKAKPAKAEPAKKDESEVKTEKKAPSKAKPAAPVKKAAAKPKAEKTEKAEEPVEKKAPAKKAAAKPKAEKSGVKKNE
ncbi:MAG TPA: 50S ribosomal protein L32e [Methanoregula sp.]|nr:50S ribosomal protein L32e [Methanoregula sp.]